MDSFWWCICKNKIVQDCSYYKAGVALEILDWGSKVRGSGDGSPLVGSRGKAPVGLGGLGDKVPQNLKHFWKVGINFYKKNNWNRLLREKIGTVVFSEAIIIIVFDTVHHILIKTSTGRASISLLHIRLSCYRYAPKDKHSRWPAIGTHANLLSHCLYSATLNVTPTRPRPKKETHRIWAIPTSGLGRGWAARTPAPPAQRRPCYKEIGWNNFLANVVGSQKFWPP